MESSSSDFDVGKQDGSEAIARRRSKRIIRQPERNIGCVNSCDFDSIAFSLATSEDINTKEPQS